MKHRGVKIVAVKGSECYDGRNHRGEPTVKIREVTLGYAMVGTTFPETLSEAKATVDRLIGQVMKTCGVDEKAAIKLLNEE